MEALGAMLAGGGGPPASAGPTGSTPPPGADPTQAAAGADAARLQLEQTMGQIRQIGEAVKQIAAGNPLVADEAQQIQQLLKQMVVKSASVSPMQTMSSAAVPTAGMA
jgi:hypothetical protein